MMGRCAAQTPPTHVSLGLELVAYMPYLFNTSNVNMTYVACVNSCPTTAGTTLSCVGWPDICNTATPAPYASVNIGGVYCPPNAYSVQNITQVTTTSLTQSLTDT